MECWWRGLDARGPYRASTRVLYPEGVTSDEGWSLLRATREALFYSVYSSSWTPSEFQDRGLEDDPWATVLRVDGRGVRRFRGFNAFGSADPPWVVPREAGGAILLWRRRLLGPVNGVWTAVVVDAAGRELGRRLVAVSRFAVVAGAGELGAPWPPREVAVCSERAGGAAVVHVRAPAVKLFEEDGTEADGQYVTLATFERAVGDEGPPCLRAISVNNSARGGGTWLRAQGGRMEGVIDTGRLRAPVSIAGWGSAP